MGIFALVPPQTSFFLISLLDHIIQLKSYERILTLIYLLTIAYQFTVAELIIKND